MTATDSPIVPAPATASVPDTLLVVTTVLAPIVGRGALARRRRIMGAAQRLDLDRRAVRLLQRLRDRYGPGPLLLRVPGRSVAIVLTAQDALRVLDESPDPFTPASREKRGALAHFQPTGVLTTVDVRLRDERRRFNEAVLDAGCPMHRLAGRITATIHDELDDVLRRDELDWDGFVMAWWRLVRRIVLGDRARDDHGITDLLTALRHDANWSYLRPRRDRRRREFDALLRSYVDDAEPDSLAALVAGTPHAPGTDPYGQVPQWLFAFDAAGMATAQALALLAGHPAHAETALAEVETATAELPFLRACVLDAVRLWPTTPVILRDSTADTTWSGGTVPAGTEFVIIAPFLHRDDATVPFADRFAPDGWLDDATATRMAGLVPFSAGPGRCPGRELVLLVASTALATVLARRRVRLLRPALDPARPLPATLSPFGLRFGLSARDTG